MAHPRPWWPQTRAPSALERSLRGPWSQYRVYSNTVSLHCVLSRLRLRTVGILGDRLVRESVSVAKKASRGFPPPRCPEIMPPDSPGKTSEMHYSMLRCPAKSVGAKRMAFVLAPIGALEMRFELGTDVLLGVQPQKLAMGKPIL